MKIVSGKFKNRELKTPRGDTTRPTSSLTRAAVFNICQHEINRSDFLDIFAGSGAMGIEAISRGAAHATFIENHPLPLNALKSNILNLKIDDVTSIRRGDALKVISKLNNEGRSFDIIFADPPYEWGFKEPPFRETQAEQILQLIDRSNLLKPTGLLFLEEGGEIDTKLSSLILFNKRKLGKAWLHLYKKTI